MDTTTRIVPKRRPNLADRDSEHWKPPNFRPLTTPYRRAIAALRRFCDLQFGSIWLDLRPVLRSAQGRVLDVGCGAQPLRSLMPAAAEYLGIDTAAAKEHFGYEVPDTIYFSGPAWPVGSESIDLVLCTEVLEHVPEPVALLAEAFRCLRPGGRLALTVPFSARWHYIPHDYWRFTPSGLRQVLTAAGFESLEIYARGNEVTVACYKVNALVLPLLFPQAKSRTKAALLRLLGLFLLPIFAALTVLANLSLRLSRGGDDCLGYTALARKPAIGPVGGSGSDPGETHRVDRSQRHGPHRCGSHGSELDRIGDRGRAGSHPPNAL